MSVSAREICKTNGFRAGLVAEARHSGHMAWLRGTSKGKRELLSFEEAECLKLFIELRRNGLSIAASDKITAAWMNAGLAALDYEICPGITVSVKSR